MRFSPVVLAPAAALLIAGCGGSHSSTSSTTSTTSTTKAPNNATIDFHVTGGIAGVDQELKIDAQGRARVTTSYHQSCNANGCSSDDQVAGIRLTPVQLADLRDKLMAADIGHLPPPPPSGCADCFIYSVNFLGLFYEADQVSIPKPLEPAIAALAKLVAKGSPQHKPSISVK